MFNVGDRVRLLQFGRLTGSLGTIVEVEQGTYDMFYWTNVDGYSDVDPIAKLINAGYREDGCVPLNDFDLELVNV